MQKPIQIYLDSSDLSALSDTDRYQREPDLEATRRKLEQYVELGDISIRLSFVHIIEMIHRDSSSKQKALERAEFAKSISNDNYFYYPQELYIRDALHYLNIQSPSIDNLPFPEYAFAGKGGWLPEFNDLDINIEREVRDSIQNTLKETALPRQNRKAIEKQLIKKGKLTTQSIELISKEQENGLNERLSKQYPLTDRFWTEDLFFKYAMGKIPLQTIREELRLGMCDPVNLIGWIVDSTNSGRGLPNWLQKLGASTILKIYDLREKVQTLWELGRKAGYTDEQIKAKAKSAVPKFEGLRLGVLNSEYTSNKKRLNSLGVKHSLWKSEILTSKVGALPAFDCYTSALYIYLAEDGTSIQRPRELLPSDAGDITHATYLPYVDIYRTDRHMAHRLRNLGTQYSTTIVKQLSKLPDTIDTMLRV